MAKKSKEATDWKTAGEETLTTALRRLDVIASDCPDAKTLESIVKTVGDIVGAGLYLARGQQKPQHQDGGDDE